MLIIYLFFLIQSTLSKNIIVDYHYIDYKMYIRLAVGEPYLSFLGQIDIEKNYSTFTTYSYKHNFSTTLNNHGISKIPIEGITYYTDLCEDNIRLLPYDIKSEDISKQPRIPGFYFYLIDHEMVDTYEIISLSFHSEHSLIDLLYKNNVINKRVFSILPMPKKDKGNIIFGEYSMPHQYKAILPVNQKYNNNTWGSDLKQFRLVVQGKEYSYDIHNYSYFQTNIRDIYAPHSFLGFLNETILSLPGWKENCEFGHYYKVNKIKCDCSLIKDPIKMRFVFGKYIFDTDEIFETSLNLCFFILRFKPVNDNQWIIGNWFLKKFPSSFDYDHSQITFYNEQPFEIINNDSTLLKGILNVNVVILMICLVINIYSLILLK